MRSTILAAKRARAFRRALTLPEGLLWRALRRGGAGGRFRRQHPIGPYILDFYCPEARLAVEVDGGSHEHRVEHDLRRDAWLAAQGVQVMRFPATAVLDDHGIEVVVSEIRAAVAGSSPVHGGGGPEGRRGRG